MRYPVKDVIRVTLVAVAILSPFGYAQDFEAVQIKTHPVTDSIYMLEGRGGNIGLCVGADTAFLIDDQFAPLTEKIEAAVAEVTDHEIQFVINTHWHFDHVGGNENLGKAGAVIVAQENVRERMSTEQVVKFFNRTVPPAPKAALPVITFSRDIRFHLNDEQIDIVHVENAHTDGDSVVFFKNANVVHTGDVYFNGLYPFIDVDTHGSINGMIEAAKMVLSRINRDTKVIPGHGPLSTQPGLTAYVRMLEAIRDRIHTHIRNGKSLDEIKAARPTKAFDADWGNGFLSPDQFVELVYKSL